MDSILLRIEQDSAEAMKAKREVELSTLRLVRAAIKNAQIELRLKGPTDDEQIAITVLKRHIKQTTEAMVDFEKGGRQDLITRAISEIAVMQGYLPEEMSDADLTKAVYAACALAAEGTATGKLIGDVMKQLAGRADGARVRAAVESWRSTNGSAHP